MKKTITLIIFIIVAMIFLLAIGGNAVAQEIDLIMTWKLLKIKAEHLDNDVFLRIYDFDKNLLLKDSIPSQLTATLFQVNLDEREEYRFNLKAYVPDNKTNKESIGDAIAIWNIKADTVAPKSPENPDVFRPKVIIEFNQYHRYRKFNIIITNLSGRMIDNIYFSLGNCVFDWIHGDDISLFAGENDGIVSNKFIYDREIRFNQVVKLDIDIDKSGEVHAFTEDVEGEIMINNYIGELVKEGDNYKCEIRF